MYIFVCFAQTSRKCAHQLKGAKYTTHVKPNQLNLFALKFALVRHPSVVCELIARVHSSSLVSDCIIIGFSLVFCLFSFFLCIDPVLIFVFALHTFAHIISNVSLRNRKLKVKLCYMHMQGLKWCETVGCLVGWMDEMEWDGCVRWVRAKEVTEVNELKMSL